MSKFNQRKLFPIFLALSAVVIVAGIILYALLGFNTVMDKPRSYVLEVRYDATITSGEGETGEDKLLAKCEEELKGAGLSYTVETSAVVTPNSSSTSLGETAYMVTRYLLSGTDEETHDAALSVETAVREYLEANGTEEGSLFYWADASVTMHEDVNIPFNEAAWRGAVAIAVGVVVALAYVTIRFGVSCGVAGLVCCAHDALFTAAFFAITRIPVFSLAPVLYGAVAALLSAVVWILFASKIRAGYKEGAYANLNADEVAGEAVRSSAKTVAIVAAAFAAVIVVLGLIAAGGTRAILLPALVAAAVPVYSTLLIAPSVFAPIRKSFDKKRAAGKIRYIGKKKKAEIPEEE